MKAEILVHPHLRERLASVVEQIGSLHAAAEALDLKPRQIEQLLAENSRASEATLCLVECRLQELACDLVQRLPSVARLVAGVPARDGRCLVRDERGQLRVEQLEVGRG